MTVGDSSKFVGQADGLKGHDHFHGVIKALNLKGTDFTDVKFDYEQHDEEDHDHDEEGGEHSEG